MSGKINNTIEGVIHLAKKFNELGDVSIYSLLKETGYFDLHKLISESAIRDAILRCPECVSQWFSFSENKRSSTGWYFRRDNNIYVVGYFSLNAKALPPIQYTDEVKACAAYIKREIEEIRGGATNKTLSSGLYLIGACLISLAFFWFSVFAFKYLGGDRTSREVVVLSMTCIVISIGACIVALVFYTVVCFGVWRNPNLANWRLWAFGTALLLAAVGSVLFYS